MASTISNPPAWRATGRGYYNRIPNFVANAKNANGWLINTGLGRNNRNRDIYVFVTGITTGWDVAGSYGQSSGARTFYPRNLTQQPITIEGIVANQYEFDRIGEFILAHHHRATDIHNPKDLDGTRAIEFRMKPYKVRAGTNRKGQPIYRYINRGLPGGNNGIKVQGYITNWQAGAVRFQNAPTWTCQFQVSYDFMDNPIHLQGEENKILIQNYLKTFGQLYDANGKKKSISLPKGDGFQHIQVDPNGGDFFSDPTRGDSVIQIS